MIAHNLALGRKVLFVSEKQAALNVVYKRLKEIGLGPFCLELHSNKARKVEVLGTVQGSVGNLQNTNSSCVAGRNHKIKEPPGLPERLRSRAS